MNNKIKILGLTFCLTLGSVLVSCGNENESNYKHNDSDFLKEYINIDNRALNKVSEKEIIDVFNYTISGIKYYKGPIEYQITNEDQPEKLTTIKVNIKNNDLFKHSTFKENYFQEFWTNEGNKTVIYSKSETSTGTKYFIDKINKINNYDDMIYYLVQKNIVKTYKDLLKKLISLKGSNPDSLAYSYYKVDGTSLYKVKAVGTNSYGDVLTESICFGSHYLYQHTYEMKTRNDFINETTKYKTLESFNYEFINSFKKEVKDNSK